MYSASSTAWNSWSFQASLFSEEHYLMRQHVCLKWTFTCLKWAFTKCLLYIRHCSSVAGPRFIFWMILWSKFYNYPYFTLFKKHSIEKWDNFQEVQSHDWTWASGSRFIPSLHNSSLYLEAPGVWVQSLSTSGLQSLKAPAGCGYHGKGNHVKYTVSIKNWGEASPIFTLKES